MWSSSMALMQFLMWLRICRRAQAWRGWSGRRTCWRSRRSCWRSSSLDPSQTLSALAETSANMHQFYQRANVCSGHLQDLPRLLIQFLDVRAAAAVRPPVRQRSSSRQGAGGAQPCDSGFDGRHAARNPWRQLECAGRHASSRLAFALEAPRASVIITTAASPASNRPTRRGRCIGFLASSSRANAGSHSATGAGSSSTTL